MEFPKLKTLNKIRTTVTYKSHVILKTPRELWFSKDQIIGIIGVSRKQFNNLEKTFFEEIKIGTDAWLKEFVNKNLRLAPNKTTLFSSGIALGFWHKTAKTLEAREHFISSPIYHLDPEQLARDPSFFDRAKNDYGIILESPKPVSKKEETLNGR